MSTQPLYSDEYTQFCDGIRRLTGIDLAQYKRPQMERRIRSFADRRGITSLNAYLTALADDPAQLEQFLDRVTINVSQLWRNPEQFVRLAMDVIPGLAETGRIRCWLQRRPQKSLPQCCTNRWRWLCPKRPRFPPRSDYRPRTE